MNIDKLKETYEKASSTSQAVMRASIGISTVLDSGLDRSIKVDTLMAIMKALVCEIEIGTIMRIIDVSDKTGAPAEVVMGQLGIARLDQVEGLNLRVANLIDLYVDEIKEKITAKEATAGAAA
ncbi:MAG: hypothetical protein WC807_14630 [Hyphomicrobium sp.]